MNANTIIYSSDVDWLQSNLIVFKNNQCLWIDFDECEKTFVVYSFDLLTKFESWVNLNDINISCDTNYKKYIKKSQYITYTNDVCWYYGAINLNGCPITYNETELLELINSISL
jgi:hypothetical protein